MDFRTDIFTNNIKLIKPINETAIPIVIQKLEQLNLTVSTIEDIIEDLNTNINEFSVDNLYFFVIMSSFAVLFVGYFTGLTIYQERNRIIDSMYRTGALRVQLLGFFTLEYFMSNFLPMLITILCSLPLIRIIAIYLLEVREVYYPFKPNIPIWLIIVILVSGILFSSIGWLIALVPAIYRYRPTKQE